MVCHSRAQNFVLGLCEVQMNKDHNYRGQHDNQLRALSHLGMLKIDWTVEVRERLRKNGESRGLKGKPLDEYVRLNSPPPGTPPLTAAKALREAPQLFTRLVDPYDRKQELNQRARSWLHVNCSSCHIEAGGGNAQMELEFVTALDKMRILEVKPQHHTFDLMDARLVSPGHPDRSVLLKRVGMRGAGQMPPLASSRIDTEGQLLLREWIRSLKP
jgi:mono/diheme cytochrome c family protein